jgi:hypothetical protein
MTSGRRDGDRRVTTYEFARFYFLAIQGWLPLWAPFLTGVKYRLLTWF